ncbi:hypothetical protein [Neptunomonas qingdaonensis]|nr:hypothetical protein [Neptunomonas qingdaonensis]
MEDSLSMFEWGLYRTEESFKEKKFKDLDIVVRNMFRAEYDWDLNRINLTVNVYPSYSSVMNTGAKNICRAVILDIKGDLGYGFDKELRHLISISRFFVHKGFSNKNEPQNLMEDLEHMTNVKVQVLASKTNESKFSLKAACTSGLSEKDIYFFDS